MNDDEASHKMRRSSIKMHHEKAGDRIGSRDKARNISGHIINCLFRYSISVGTRLERMCISSIAILKGLLTLENDNSDWVD